MKLKYIVAVVLVGSTLLTACGKSGGGSNSASTPATSFSGSPAGWIGNGSWNGQVTVAEAQKPTYYQMAALTGLCYAQGCYQSSYFTVRVQLNSNGGNQYYIQGQPQTQQATTTQASFSLRGTNGSFTRQCVEVSGGSASFQMRSGLYSQGNCGYATAIAAGEPVVQINGQFTDASQSVLNVQVYYNGALVGQGQLVGNGNGGYYGNVGGNQYYDNSYYYQTGGQPYYQGGNQYYRTGGYIYVNGYYYPMSRK